MDVLKKNEDKLKLERSNLPKVVEDLKCQLSQVEWVKNIALDELQAKFMLEVKSQIQEAYVLGWD